jgi:ketosteroid isomerase-like protein
MKLPTVVLVVAVCVIAAAAFLLPGKLYSTSPGKPTPEMLKQLEADFMKAAAEKGSQGYMSYYADDSVEAPNGAPLIQGKAEIAKGMGFLDQKDNHLAWTPVGADISASGDLGYTYGYYEFQHTDKAGKRIAEHGKYTSIWKLQKDGSWKVVLDMGNLGPDPIP